jgi:hypothetical protein
MLDDRVQNDPVFGSENEFRSLGHGGIFYSIKGVKMQSKTGPCKFSSLSER